MKPVSYKKAVTFSYDDGVSQDIRLVKIFHQYGMKATFNLNTGIQTEESRFAINGMPVHRMNQADGLVRLYQEHEIAIHGLTHASPTGLDRKELAQEFQQDAWNIERIYGAYPTGMAYAYGNYDDTVIAYLQDIGIQYGRTVESSYGFDLPEDPMRLRPTCHHGDERLFALAEEFLAAEPGAEDKPMLFYIWGHSYEFDVDDNWDRIETLCQMLGGREDIFYGTNAQCLGLMP